MTADQTMVIEHAGEDRFARFRAIKWWDQSLLNRARVLVVGAGALGNEGIKNLALLGIGNLIVIDRDTIEESNLSRSVLFTSGDEGKAKAVVAATSAVRIYPQLRALPIPANILSDVGLGYFRWADIVVGALDNREARVFVNQACARVGRPWIDGGIDILNGIVRGFAPPQSACYECTMGQGDWDLLAKRRSCSLLARRAMAEGGTPTTPTTASVVGAIQAQEVIKHLHGLEVLVGRGFVFEGLTHNSFTVGYPISPDCPWHDPPADIEAVEEFNSQTPLRQIWNWSESKLGGLDAIDLSREMVESLQCTNCGRSAPMFKPLDSITEEDARCDGCGSERTPTFFHSIARNSALLDRSCEQLGLPRWDILWPRCKERALGVELSGDRRHCLHEAVDSAGDRPPSRKGGESHGSSLR